MKKIIPIIFSLFVTSNQLFAQGAPACPSVNAGSPVTICNGQCTTLSAAVVSNNQTSSYSVSSIPYVPYPYTGAAILVGADDVWSSTVNLGFNFCYFGNHYNQAVLGDNGELTFDLTNANGYDNWQLTTALPNTNDLPGPTICGAFRDMDGGLGGHSYIETLGTAPCRELIMSWVNVPLFDNGAGVCNGTPNTTLQIVLYENTNYIDVYIQNSFSCAAWNGGAGIIGIQNAAGTVAVCPPNRNFPTAWTANNEAWRFSPTGAPSYAINWTGPLGVVGAGTSVSVCPTTNSTYTATMTVTNCDGGVTTYANTVPVTVTTNTPVTLAPTTGTICGGVGNVSLVATGAGTFSWSPAGGLNVTTGTTVLANPVAATTYTVTQTNGACSSKATAVVSVGNPATLSSTQTNIACNGGSTGASTVTASLGTAPYTYAWSGGGGTAATASGLAAGTYVVTVSTALGCQSTNTVTLTQPTALALTTGSTAANCGGSTGTATVTANGGTSAYTYSWSPAPAGGQLTPTATGLPANTYSVLVTDAHGCTKNTTMVVTNVAGPTSALGPIANNSCNASCNGTATVNAAGGTGLLTYSWSGNPSTTATASSLCVGTYTCTVTDANGCKITQPATITQPAVLTLTPGTTAATCGSSNGQATVAVIGGTVGYTYSWVPAPTGGQGTNTATGLAAGTYTVTVTDHNLCVQSLPITVNNNGGPAVSLSTSAAPACNGGCNGTATITATGGTGALTYSWSPNVGAAATVSNLCSGTSYTCNVKDANGCLSSQIVTVTQPSLLTLTPTNTNTSCHAVCDGTATATAGGGTGSYTYSWSPNVNSTLTASALCQGTYTCHLTDAHGCTTQQTYTITQPAALTSVPASTAALCNGSCNGTATITAGGGTSGYTYSWTGNPSTTPTANLLCAGTYSCTLTDAHGCSRVQPVTVTQPAILSLTPGSTPSTCGAANGQATVAVSGGTAAYSFNWIPLPTAGQGTNTATGLAASTYTVTVTDLNSCVQSSVIAVINSGAPTVSLASSGQPACNGNCNGTASITATGGTGALTYSWSPNTGAGFSASNLCSGTVYTCFVKDANGCLSTQTVSVTQPGLLSIAPSNTNTSCNASCDGTATATASGGTSAYTYSWSPNINATATATALCQGAYTCHITDANGCTALQSYTITQPALLTSIPASTKALCNGGSTGTASVSVAGGTTGYTYSWSPNTSASATAIGLSASTYTCHITDAHGCTQTQLVTIGQPPALTSSDTPVPSTCKQSNGSISVLALGGTVNYTYSWSPAPAAGQTTANATGLLSNLYTCIITDSAGCISTITDSVTNTGTKPVATLSSGGVTTFCNGNTVPLTAGGGTTYSWNTGSISNPLTVNGGGSYTVYVSNACGIDSNKITLTEDSLPRATVSGVAKICSGFTSVLNATGGASYHWNTGATTASITAAVGGIYAVAVTNFCGTDSAHFTVLEDSAHAFFTSNVSSGTIPLPITFTDSSGSNTQIWSWNFGDGNTSSNVNTNHTYPNGGTYTVVLTVTDSDGCKSTRTEVIDVKELPSWITVPNVFTPNGDGHNDLFLVSSQGIVTFEASIFDRWGVEMAVLNAPQMGWDGRTVGGESAVNGTYFYILHATGDDGKVYNFNGFLTLIR